DCNGAVGDCVGDIILAVEARAPEGAEHRARRDLPVVDREARDRRRLVAAGQGAQVHLCSSITSPPVRSGAIRSPVGMSRLMSGMMPSSGPVREMTRATTGAAVQAAVVWPEVAALGRGESSMTSTT